MIKDRRVDIFENMSIPRAAAALAVPTMLTNTISIFYNLADNYFVGMLGDPRQNAAVTLAGPVLLAFNAVNNLFGVGCSSLMSRSLGRRDYETVRNTSAFGFYSTFFFALLFSLVCTLFRPGLMGLLGVSSETAAATEVYLRWTVSLGACPTILSVVMANMVKSEGAALHASIGTISGCILNMLLDPLFVLPSGLGLGAEGAAIATFISNCTACSYFFILILSKRRKGITFISLSPSDFRFRKEIMKDVFSVGVPACVQNLLNVTGMTLLNGYTASFGADAVAAMGISQRIHNVPYSMGMGSATGVMPLISYNWASGNRERMRKAVRFTAFSVVSFMFAASAVLFTFSTGLVRTFMNFPSVVELGGWFLRIFSLTLPLLAMDFLAVSIFQAIGKGRASLIFALARKLLLEIPLLMLMNEVWPLYGLPFAQVAAETVMAFSAVVAVTRILKRSVN